MNSKPHLIFSLHGLSYAIATEGVREIFLLPELIPINESPTDIIGLLDFHGRVIPVMHLDLRFGHHVLECHLTDRVIVVESQGLTVGIVVHEVWGVNEIESQLIQVDFNYGRGLEINAAFIAGIIKLDGQTIPLLNSDNLIRHPDLVTELGEKTNPKEGKNTIKSATSFYDLYCPQASNKDRAIFRQRADNLQVSDFELEASDLLPVVVVNLGGEYLGFNLDFVREFIDIDRITTIPCCPKHIMGNINHRGEILTLLDLCPILQLQPTQSKATKAVAIDFEDIVVGITVDEVSDVIYFRPQELKPVPVAINANSAQYLQGTATYLNRRLNIIDISKMLSQGELTVDRVA
jgi:purine-binding chemotaxis protein CheW